MNVEFLYAAFVYVITPLWLLLMIAPKWRWTDRIVHAIWIPFALGAWMITLTLLKPAAPAGAGMGSMAAVVLLTNGPEGSLISWTMLMGWDFLAGAWLARDARRLGIHHFWVIVSLAVAYMLGIFGLLMYLLVRLVARRRWTMHETDSGTPVTPA